MKKIRILSLMLAMSTVAASLPVSMHAEAASEPTLSEELIVQSDVLKEANWSNGTGGTLNADVVTVSENGTNTALYMYDAKEYSTNKYTYTLKADLPAGTYRVKIDRAAQIDGVEQAVDNYYIRVNGGQQEMKDSEYDGKDTYTKDITLSEAVTQIPFEFYYIPDNARLGMIYPRTFDNIAIYKIVGGVESDTPVVVRTFENGLENGDTWKKSINKATAVDAELITESDYVRIDAVTGTGTVEEAVAAGAYSEAAKYSPDEAITLEPGVYEFSFDGRMSYFFSNSYHNNDEYVYEYEKLLENDADAVPEKGFNTKTSGWASTSSQWKYWKNPDNKGFWNKVDTVYHKLYRDNNPACGDYNYRDVVVTVTGKNAEDGEVDVLGTSIKTVKHYWQEGYKFAFSVPAGKTYTLDGISFGGTGLAYDNDAFDVKNFSLKCVSSFVKDFTSGDADNALDGAVIYLDNAYSTDVDTVPDGYISVGARNGDPRPFLYMTVDHSPVVDATYYLSFDIKVESDMVIRAPYVNVATEYTEGMSYSGQLVHAEGSELTTKNWGPANGIQTETIFGGVEYTFVGTFTPTESAKKLEFRIDRGSNSAFSKIPMEFDNIKVWYEKDGVTTPVIEEGFDHETDISFINGKGKCPISQIIPVSKYTLYEPVDNSKEMTITYGVNLDSAEAVEGKYSFEAQIRLSEKNASPVKAKIIFEYSDGSKKFHHADITNEWSTISISDNLGVYTKLENVLIVVDADVSVQIADPSLRINGKEKYDIPNIGIMMMLMKFKGMETRTMRRTVEFIKNGEFNDKSAFDFSSVASSYAGLPANAWMNNKNYAGNMEIITVDGNNVLSVSEISSGPSGIALGLGKLNPGEYTLKFDVKLTNKGESCGMRFSVNHTDKPDSYIVSNNNDIRKISADKWTTVTFNFTISSPTDAIVRFRGGMGGEVDTKSFCLDNISLKSVQNVVIRTDGSNPDVNVGDIQGDVSVKRLITSINFDDASSFDFNAVATSYAELPANAWMNNKNYASKMEIIPVDGNNIMSVSGIGVNHSGIALGLGKLDAGNYTLNFNVKLANAGDSCGMRFSVNYADKPDTYIASNNNDIRTIAADQWTTVTFNFTVTEAGDAIVRFRGGMGGEADTKSFYLDNISLYRG